jgi:hypothetical protein
MRLAIPQYDNVLHLYSSVNFTSFTVPFTCNKKNFQYFKLSPNFKDTQQTGRPRKIKLDECDKLAYNTLKKVKVKLSPCLTN